MLPEAEEAPSFYATLGSSGKQARVYMEVLLWTTCSGCIQIRTLSFVLVVHLEDYAVDFCVSGSLKNCLNYFVPM